MEYISKDTLKADAEHRIKEYKSQIEKADFKLTEDFKSALSWGNAETKYKAMRCIELLEKLIKFIDEPREKLVEWVPFNIKYSLERLIANQHIVVGGSYWGRLCVLMENECLVWWMEYMKEVESYIGYGKSLK